ncbi:isochorismatase family cysteine hydrolase [uncultured Williamsia sp.]|uniref:cysteine hydrolase family protein n=1 Tax=uncultured Williamsia sp. TaxID=259311 RepID=UPI00262CB852|nr:isochorismatase family cysteine hydrolase [uncultured Williamsia sp.]
MASALLVMDFQNGIVDRFDSAATLANAVSATDAARAAGVPVVFVRVAFRPGYPEVAATNLGFGRLADAAGDSMTESAHGTQIHPALAPRPDEAIVTKRRVSAFTGSDLEVLLRGLDASEIVLAGISTSGVVLSTLRQAADLDYRITVLSDACADTQTDVHEVLMTSVFPRQATVTTTADWVSSLS